jgi:hypothetical protein
MVNLVQLRAHVMEVSDINYRTRTDSEASLPLRVHPTTIDCEKWKCWSATAATDCEVALRRRCRITFCFLSRYVPVKINVPWNWTTERYPQITSFDLVTFKVYQAYSLISWHPPCLIFLCPWAILPTRWRWPLPLLSLSTRVRCRQVTLPLSHPPHLGDDPYPFLLYPPQVRCRQIKTFSNRVSNSRTLPTIWTFESTTHELTS